MPRPVEYPDGRKSTTLRLEAAMMDRLDEAAAKRGLGRNRMIELLIAYGLDRLIPVKDVLRTWPPCPGCGGTVRPGPGGCPVCGPDAERMADGPGA